MHWKHRRWNKARCVESKLRVVPLLVCAMLSALANTPRTLSGQVWPLNDVCTAVQQHNSLAWSTMTSRTARLRLSIKVPQVCTQQRSMLSLSRSNRNNDDRLTDSS